MSDNMSEMIQKVNDMIKNNQIPDEVREMMNQFSSNSNSTNDNDSVNDTSDTTIPNIDMATMLKMKSIIESMNKPQNDPRANLLKSLKPYLKASRKGKVDQYIQLFSMGKVFEAMGPLGGKEKNDG